VTDDGGIIDLDVDGVENLPRTVPRVGANGQADKAASGRGASTAQTGPTSSGRAVVSPTDYRSVSRMLGPSWLPTAGASRTRFTTWPTSSGT
jgi:hypothetical protein